MKECTFHSDLYLSSFRQNTLLLLWGLDSNFIWLQNLLQQCVYTTREDIFWIIARYTNNYAIKKSRIIFNTNIFVYIEKEVLMSMSTMPWLSGLGFTRLFFVLSLTICCYIPYPDGNSWNWLQCGFVMLGKLVIFCLYWCWFLGVSGHVGIEKHRDNHLAWIFQQSGFDYFFEGWFALVY